jgi:FtsP/CotA-like multicopper oxidase with cupredoxin domain
MTAAATNLHFHGLALPPLCHQDETLRTLVLPGDPAFDYRLRIAPTQSPGLYWYHPHVHGFTEEHLLGGASGAIVVDGIEHTVPELKDLSERVLIIRDERMPDALPPTVPADSQRPTKQLSINGVPVHYPNYLPARIEMRSGSRELWRVLNACADTYLNLYVEYAGKRQLLDLVARDGVPLTWGQPDSRKRVLPTTFVFLPPGARGEFVVTAPPAGTTGMLMTGFVDRGAGDDAPAPARARKAGGVADQADRDPTRPLASIAVSESAHPSARLVSAGTNPPRAARQPNLRPVRARTLYFSESPADPNDPASAIRFFLTVEGQAPASFDPHQHHPNIEVRLGDVEDWTIENRSREVHTFHIHQLHFQLVARDGIPVAEHDVRDTANVPAWRGTGSYPSLTLRMDFRDPRIVGLIPFHCHIAQHLDGGMMGTVRVTTRPVITATSSADPR